MEVLVVSHRDEWEEIFESEKTQLGKVFGNLVEAIHHIGSTAIFSIYAKPIIDILIEVSDISKADSRNEQMEGLGYECMGEFGIEGRRYFRKDNKEGKRTHHIHAFQSGSSGVRRHLAFRDYLIEHDEIAGEYSDLKRKLVKQNPGSIEAYMDGKDLFIKRVEAEALSWWK